MFLGASHSPFTVGASLSTTENRPGLEFVLRTSIRVASSGAIVAGSGGGGKKKIPRFRHFFVNRPWN